MEKGTNHLQWKVLAKACRYLRRAVHFTFLQLAQTPSFLLGVNSIDVLDGKWRWVVTSFMVAR
jgi:hypothetical protein